jgi:hypothetical protein
VLKHDLDPAQRANWERAAALLLKILLPRRRWTGPNRFTLFTQTESN